MQIDFHSNIDWKYYHYASYKNCGYAYFFLLIPYFDDKDNVYKYAVATYNKTIRDGAVIMNLQS